MSEQYWLAQGSHATPAEGRCAMEWVSYLAGEAHTDQPVCVSPVLQSFAISLNDKWDDEQRQKLRPYLARCIGTAGDGRDEERGWLALDWLIRVFTPRFMDLCPDLAGHARNLRGLSPVMGPVALADAMATVDAAQDAARDALGAAVARGAAGDDDDAWTAAADIAWDVARDVAWPAWDAARDAAAVSIAAWAIAWDAGQAAAWAADDGAAAWDVLVPAVIELQASTLDLFDRMLPKEIIQLPVVEDADAVCGLSA